MSVSCSAAHAGTHVIPGVLNIVLINGHSGAGDTERSKLEGTGLG